VNELGRGFGLDLLQVVAEAGFGGAPVGDGVALDFAGGLGLGLVPIEIDGGVALEVEGFLIGFAEAGVEDELRRAAESRTRWAW
jgi:hypothetical protein